MAQVVEVVLPGGRVDYDIVQLGSSVGVIVLLPHVHQLL